MRNTNSIPLPRRVDRNRYPYRTQATPPRRSRPPSTPPPRRPRQTRGRASAPPSLRTPPRRGPRASVSFGRVRWAANIVCQSNSCSNEVLILTNLTITSCNFLGGVVILVGSSGADLVPAAKSPPPDRPPVRPDAPPPRPAAPAAPAAAAGAVPPPAAAKAPLAAQPPAAEPKPDR